MKIKQYLLASVLTLISLQDVTAQAKHTFTIDKNNFMLDGKPFQIISGEMHYARVPRAYWRDRLKKARAMGLNTICTYMFWNAHEPVQGRYDFKDNLDIAEFCKEAAEEGLWVIIRPGPYTCAEWDLGGLPSWLLKNKNIVLRSSDPNYMPHTLKFLNRAVQSFKNVQITKGGNVLMVQVENEYGEYGSDKAYLNSIKHTLLDAGVDVPLFNCDWAGKKYYDKGYVEGVIPTLNFGGNAKKNFETFAGYAPNGPRFNSEFWTGWFDYWGGKHEVHSAQEKLADFKWMVDNGISVNLYMFHGGTSNGFFPGANGSNTYFTPYTTSYDYDAPLNENGEPNEKFFAFRDVILHKYPELKLPELPKPIQKITIPEFKLTPFASLQHNLPAPRFFDTPQPMEALDQAYGLILYAHDFDGELKGELKITRVMDRATIYVDGKKLGVLDRRLNQSALQVNTAAGKHRLEIWIEPLGRVNFGAAIDHERKGITEGVYLNGKALKGWQHYQFPLDRLGSFKASARKDGYPELMKGSFQVNEIGDTYLDTRNLDHGLLWLNDKLIGRYWSIGPQQTLYIPGCWLKKGNNQITVLELGNPKNRSLKGVKDQIWATQLDSTLLHSKAGQQLVLSQDQLVKAGVLTDKEGWQNVQLDKPVTGRYICLESTSSYEQSPVASIAELRIIDARGQEVPREECSILYADSEEFEKENGLATLLMDNQPTTSWQTRWSHEKRAQPHQVVIDLGKNISVAGFSYLPGAQKIKAKVKDFNLYVSKAMFLIQDKNEK
ncbi:beta-galactosidase [Pedobacter sp. MC2016-24]|uniref:beta-galactosidase n=1 Tax=Pedobacter sp. MC2016-24 TaxID=2780090 RepID=UPI00187F2787|nr:beta-galactosidase [Pedobacter sp. MC2016-24]MBE9599754.1 beta-galactosidase [Pedobacter sp. MC2016-24]